MRGRRDTFGTGKALVARLVAGDAARLCVARVALGDRDCDFAWCAMDLHFASRRPSVLMINMNKHTYIFANTTHAQTNTHTHTDLPKLIFANYDVECPGCASTTPIKMKGVETSRVEK